MATSRKKTLFFPLSLCTLFCFLAAVFPSLWAEDGKEEDEAPRGRPLHYLSTDKGIYRPGECVYMRDVVLDGITNYPLPSLVDGEGLFRWKVLGPREDEVASGEVSYKDSVGAMIWEIPADVAGGDYVLRVEGDDGAPAQRKFRIRRYRAPRLRTQLDFLKRGYLPGEEVVAVVRATRADGTELTSAKASASVLLDGEMVFQQEEIPWSDGVGRVSFPLPKEIAAGEGVLNVVIEDGGDLETAARSLPILLENYSVAFYPEGGDLVLGVPNRVYVEATRADGQGADLSGVVRDDLGAELCRYESVFDGRGILEFTPAAGRAYRLEVPSPVTGAVRSFTLPPAKSGSVLRAVKKAFDFQEPVQVEVSTSPEGARKPSVVVLRKRDKELARVEVPAQGGVVSLQPGEEEGVLTATLYAADKTPLAERLLFRRPRYRVHLEFQGVETPRNPGDKATLAVVAKDEKGTPVEATVGLCVTDATAASLVDRRDRAPRLPVMVYLENEVLELTDAEDYFDAADPLAGDKIDLLLGTQGWRRFVLERREEIGKLHADALARILAPEVRAFHPILLRNKRMRFGQANGAMPAMLLAAAAAPDGVEEIEEGAMVMEAFGGALPEAVDAVVEDAEAAADGAADAPARAKAFRPGPWDRGPKWRREYAHQARKDRKPGERVDFTETIYWNAGVKTDPRTGRAEFSFELPDTLGGFQVRADAFGNNGALGEATAELPCVRPFYGEIKLPLSLTVGDTAWLPITLVNASDKPLDNANLSLASSDDCLEILEAPVLGAGGNTLSAGERRLVFARVRARKAGSAVLTLRSLAGGFQDELGREIRVLSPLFPFALSGGTRLSEGNPLFLEVEIPREVENGSQRVLAQVYTSPAATMEAALNALLKQPHGCFEQTSSTNYPLVMAQQYFLTHAGCNPETVARAKALLDEGYQKLVSFQCPSKGYEWFGADPGHEALSAYGLMEFADMAKVMPVDAAMMQNTRQWIMGRRDGKGGFQRNDRSLDSFGRAPAPTTDAYVVWALLEGGEPAGNLQKEIDAVVKNAREQQDDYLKALAANILWLAQRPQEARELAKSLEADQKPDGSMAHPGTTITCSGELSQRLECASLAALAWTRCGADFVLPLERTMKLLAESCQNGKFGSTQSTVLVLKAINAYDSAFAKPAADGAVQLWLDGKPFGEPVAFTKESKGILALPDCGLALAPGLHTLEIRLSGAAELNASLQVEGMTSLGRACRELSLKTRLDRDSAREGEPLQLFVEVANPLDKEAQMPLAVVALPAGTEPRQEQLTELRKSGQIAAYELRDNAVVLYWRGLSPRESRTVPISLTAAIPGEFTAAASSVYLYYNDSEKGYVPGVKVDVQRR